MEKCTLYIGTYTRPEAHVDGQGEGIYIYQMDPQTGLLTHQGTVLGVINPSYLAVAEVANLLFAVNELARADEESGFVSAFAIDPQTRQLTFLNQQPSAGVAPCHVSTTAGGNFALAANYMTGTVSVLPVAADGRLRPGMVAHPQQGSGPHPRQDGPHAHMVAPDPSGRFILATDLGTDRIWVYRLDQPTGRLIPAGQSGVAIQPGSGPRHFAFHPNGRYLYLVTELSSEIILFHYDAAEGTLSEKETQSMLPAGFSGSNLAADIHVHPSGRFLYATNRGHDSIVIYAIEARTGKLTRVGFESTRGHTPRNFAIDPAGNFLLVANQDSNNIVPFKINADNGRLTATSQVAQVPTPVCIRFYGAV